MILAVGAQLNRVWPVYLTCNPIKMRITGSLAVIRFKRYSLDEQAYASLRPTAIMTSVAMKSIQQLPSRYFCSPRPTQSPPTAKITGSNRAQI